MVQINTRDNVLLPVTTATVSGTGNDINLPQGYTGAIVYLDVQTVSGTAPTLDVFVQNKLFLPAAGDLSGNLPTGTAFYDDLLHFTQATASTTRFIFRIAGGAFSATAGASAARDAALAVASQANGFIGGTWRVKYTIGGTTPSFTFSVTAQFIP